MRFAISIVAALMILGLAAFGVVSAQKMSAPPSQTTAESAVAVCDGGADIFCADTTPKAARPSIIKAATMLIAKRIITL